MARRKGTKKGQPTKPSYYCDVNGCETMATVRGWLAGKPAAYCREHMPTDWWQTAEPLIVAHTTHRPDQPV